MSIKVMTKVFNDTSLKPTKKLIMLSLADNANDDGFCYPSITNVCKKTGLTKPTVINGIKELEAENKLISKKRHRKNGTATSKIYIIYPSENMAKMDEEIKEMFNKNIGQSKTALPPKKVKQSKTALPQNGGQSKTALPLEPSLIINHHLKTSKKEISLLNAFRESFKEEIKISDETLLDFIRYRKEIKKEIKTVTPLIAFTKALAECVKAGYSKDEVINLVKEREWQTLKLDWVKKILTKNEDNTTWSNHGTDYDDSKEWK